MKNLRKFYKNKKVLITGHTGFKGSWLTSLIYLLGAKVYGLSLSAKKDSHYRSLNLNKKIKNKKLDIRNFKKLKQHIKLVKPDVVFHLAAQSLVKTSYKKPIETWTTNVIGTLNLIESIKTLNKKCIIVIITSDKCYLNKEKNSGYKENDTLGGIDPYSASKASAEGVFFSEYNSFLKFDKKIRIASARAGNVVGGGDWSEDRIIPDFMKSIIKKEFLSVRSPGAIRPWQHVLEPLTGYLKLAYALSKNTKLNGRSFNFGPSTVAKKTVKEVLAFLNKKMILGKWKFTKNYKKNTETKILMLNSKAALKNLKWETKNSFKETMDITADWYYQFIYKKKIITFDQIKSFLKNYI